MKDNHIDDMWSQIKKDLTTDPPGITEEEKKKLRDLSEKELAEIEKNIQPMLERLMAEIEENELPPPEKLQEYYGNLFTRYYARIIKELVFLNLGLVNLTQQFRDFKNRVETDK